jgi:MFS family permease
MFFGMMFGAVGWGTCSDLMGRSTAFNATLFFTALFGILAGFAPNFFWLCVTLFLLGSAVGVGQVFEHQRDLTDLHHAGLHAYGRHALTGAYA